MNETIQGNVSLLPETIQGNVSLVDNNDSKPGYETNNTSKSVHDVYGVKKTDNEKCVDCIDGYDNSKSIYYAQDGNKDEFILLINKEGFDKLNNDYFSVQILNFSGIYPNLTKQKFNSLQELRNVYPVLKAIPIVKKYYSMDGKPLQPGEDVIPIEGLIIKELPDYKGVGLEQPTLVGGKKSRKSRKSRKYRKSRKSRK